MPKSLEIKEMTEVEAWYHLAQQIELGKWNRAGLCSELDQLQMLVDDLQSSEVLELLQNRYLPHDVTVLYGVHRYVRDEMESRMEHISQDRRGGDGYYFKRGRAEPRIIFCLLMAELATEYPNVFDMTSELANEGD
jgi:hypothetical protein